MLDPFLRFLHLFSAAALAGALLFQIVALWPAAQTLPDEMRGDLLNTLRKRFIRIQHPAIVLLLLTGLYQWHRNHAPYEAGGALTHTLLGVKIMLALLAMTIAIAASINKLPGPPARWARLNLVLLMAIFALAAALRQTRLDLLAN